MNSIRCPQAQKGASIVKLSAKKWLFSKKVCYNVSLYENVQWQSCNAFTGLSNCAQMVGDIPFNLKFWAKVTHHLQNGDLQSIFARSAWTMAPSKKNQLSLIGSALWAFQWAKDERCTFLLSPQKGDRKCKVTFFHIKVDLSCKRSMLCFLAPTTFGTEYWLTHAINHHQPKTDRPCSVVSLRQVSYLLKSTSILSIK